MQTSKQSLDAHFCKTENVGAFCLLLFTSQLRVNDSKGVEYFAEALSAPGPTQHFLLENLLSVSPVIAL